MVELQSFSVSFQIIIMGQGASSNQADPQADDRPLISDAVIATSKQYNAVREDLLKYDQELRYSPSLEEASARFKIWANNIAAARKGAASLDHRLRDASHIRTRVHELLEDIQEALNDLREIATGERLPWDAEDEESQYSDEEDNDNSNGHDGTRQVKFAPGLQDSRTISRSSTVRNEDVNQPRKVSFGIPALESQAEEEPQTEIDQILDHILDCVRGLLRLSIAIKHPAPHDRFMRSGKIDVAYHEPWDAMHVRSKYPNAPEYLTERLGKAISKRRLYLKYREQHREKLEKDLGPDNQTVASSIPSLNQSVVQKVGKIETMDYEDDISVTSYASTTAAPSSHIAIPRMPIEAEDGMEFECPYCFTITAVRNKKEWKHHVFMDLQPYVCVVENCILPDGLFLRRREWISHHAQHVAAGDNLNCPLCNETLSNANTYQRHVAHHQEQLALFILPSHEYDTDEEDEEDKEGEEEVEDEDGGEEAGEDDTELPEEEPAADPNPIMSFDFLRKNTQFRQLRKIVQEQPHLLEPILEKVGADNTQLAQLIATRSEEFLELLAEDDDDFDPSLPPSTKTMEITEEEREAIERVSDTYHHQTKTNSLL